MREIERLAAEIPVLENACPVRELGGGLASKSWLLEGGDGPFVLRMDQPLAIRLGLDRQAEWHVLGAAFEADLGPEPVFTDPAAGILVTRFLPGGTWTPEQIRRPERLEQLGQLLRCVHQIRPVGVRFEPVQIADSYARQADSHRLAAKVAEVAQLAGQLYTRGLPRRTCHGDPNVANIITARQVQLIDWEYASLNDPLFDLAVVVRYHALNRAQSHILLDAWSGGQGTGEMERLRAFGRLYNLLAGLWHEVVSAHASL